MRFRDEPYEVVSRHTTSEGVLVYVRTPDGGLQARLHRWSGGEQVVTGRPAAPSTRCA
ncbi:MAG: hypothetical protein ACRDTM_08330 [Micromonosporaceae bacterium]